MAVPDISVKGEAGQKNEECLLFKMERYGNAFPLQNKLSTEDRSFLHAR